MKSTTTLSFLKLTLLFTLSVTLLSRFHRVQAAFTSPVERNGDYVDQNAEGAWCFYPAALDPTTIDVACVGEDNADFARVMETHLNTTTSINYFSASLELLGGPEWVVNTAGANRKIYLCVTGRAGDYTYQTMCTTVGKNNSLGNGGPSPYCKVEAGQKRVTDGCYVPNQEVPSFEVSTTRKPAIVTITRTGGSTSLVRDLPATTGPPEQSGSTMKSASFGWMTVLCVAFVTLAIRI